MKCGQTFSFSFNLREIGTQSFSKAVEIETNLSGDVVGLWLDGEPVTGSVNPLQMFQQIIGSNHLSRRIVQQLAAAESLEDACTAAKSQAELAMEAG